MKNINIFTVDVEDWFHILDTPVTPELKDWGSLNLRASTGINIILKLLEETGNKATFFWLGWMAEKMPELVAKCKDFGHEVGSHGYAHLLAYEVGERNFKEDIYKSKSILEDIINEPVIGFRAPGFGITENTQWAFDVIKSAGYQYDSSIFPASRGHGGMRSSVTIPHKIETKYGDLVEFPASVIEIFNRRISLFGGGYLRIAPISLIKLGVKILQLNKQPLTVYVHPRELDPDHPRLPLSPLRRFKSYTNLSSTLPKMKVLFNSYSFCTMREAVDELVNSRIIR